MDEFNTRFKNASSSRKSESKVVRKRRWGTKTGGEASEDIESSQDIVKVKKIYEEQITEITKKFDLEISDIT